MATGSEPWAVQVCASASEPESVQVTVTVGLRVGLGLGPGPGRLNRSRRIPADIWNPDHLACKSMYRYIPVYTGIYRYILCYALLPYENQCFGMK